MQLNHTSVYMRKAWLLDDSKRMLRFQWRNNHLAYMYKNNAFVGEATLNAKDIIDVTGMHIDDIVNEFLGLEMNKNYIGKYDKVVLVSYTIDEDIPESDTKLYAFKCGLTDKLLPGDLVVVDARSGLQITRVVKVVDRSLDTQAIKQFNKAKAWVVCKVDMHDHKLRIQATERKQFIMQQLKERKEQMEEVAIYKMLAQTDSEAAKLIEELEKLS